MVEALIKDIEENLEIIFEKAQKVKPGGAEIPEIIAKIWFQLQKLNMKLVEDPKIQKMDALRQLERFVKELLENLRRVAQNLGLTSFSIEISPHLAVQITFIWQLSPLIVA